MLGDHSAGCRILLKIGVKHRQEFCRHTAKGLSEMSNMGWLASGIYFKYPEALVIPQPVLNHILAAVLES